MREHRPAPACTWARERDSRRTRRVDRCLRARHRMGVTARPAAGAAALTAAGLSALAGLAGAAATADPAHLVPRWQPTFDLASSTIVQPCNDSGLMEPSFLAKWGVRMQLRPHWWAGAALTLWPVCWCLHACRIGRRCSFDGLVEWARSLGAAEAYGLRRNAPRTGKTSESNRPDNALL